MGQLQDKVAIVTGASDGIGKAIATAFVTEGAKVVIAARSLDKLEAMAKSFKANGRNAIAVRCDVTKEADILNLFKVTKDSYGRLDVLVNNAGMATGGPTDQMPLENWQRMIDTNLTSVFLCSREALKIMKPQRYGKIIMIGSISSLTPRPNGASYATTKHGLEALTHSICQDYRDHHVTASLIRVGSTDTNFSKLPRDQAVGPEYLMDPMDVARAVVLMAAQKPEVNIYDMTILPTEQRSFIARG
jgi:NADP-dependent 3-hydroxy acid dehydrogenase YdfG